mgnify:CR=1 FL=1
MSLFTRNLARCGKSITIEDRDMDIINGHPIEVFSNPVITTALIKTVSGISVFDNTNTDTIVTHKMCLAYIAGVGAEQWINFNNKRLRIITAENCCEDNKVLIIMCTERGLDSQVVNDG